MIAYVTLAQCLTQGNTHTCELLSLLAVSLVARSVCFHLGKLGIITLVYLNYSLLHIEIRNTKAWSVAVLL